MAVLSGIPGCISISRPSSLLRTFLVRPFLFYQLTRSYKFDTIIVNLPLLYKISVTLGPLVVGYLQDYDFVKYMRCIMCKRLTASVAIRVANTWE